MNSIATCLASTLVIALISSIETFVLDTTTTSSLSSMIIQTRATSSCPSDNVWKLYNTGGWGVGPQREMVPEEFARRSDNKRIFDGYELRDRGEFMRQVRADKESMAKDELDELLGVASIAGINVKNPKDRLNKFESDLIIDNDDDDELDLTISWDEDVDTNKKDESITRFDEDTGAPGVW